MRSNLGLYRPYLLLQKELRDLLFASFYFRGGGGGGGAKRERKQKKTKLPGQPKRYATAYFIWMNASRDEVSIL
jgi:hypothetical protein